MDIFIGGHRVHTLVNTRASEVEVLVTDNPEWWVPVMGMMVQGRKVCAIKEIRGATGMGLKEAKAIADEIGDELKELERRFSVLRRYKLAEVS